MKRQFIYTISAILLLTIAVIGSTYAFFSATTNDAGGKRAEAQKFEVIYNGGEEINGPINLSADRNGGLNTTVNIRVSEGSTQALSYLYLNITEMTANLSVSNVKWEVSGMRDGQEVYTNSGTFQGYNDTTNNIITIVDGYRLSETTTYFTVYIWVDGNNAGNEMFGASLSAYISASTESFTGSLS